MWRVGREEVQGQKPGINIEGANRGWKGDWAGMVGKPEDNKVKSRKSSKQRKLSTVSEARKKSRSHWIRQQASQWCRWSPFTSGQFPPSPHSNIPLRPKEFSPALKTSPIRMESIRESEDNGDAIQRLWGTILKRSNSITDLKSTLQTTNTILKFSLPPWPNILSASNISNFFSSLFSVPSAFKLHLPQSYLSNLHPIILTAKPMRMRSQLLASTSQQSSCLPEVKLLSHHTWSYPWFLLDSSYTLFSYLSLPVLSAAPSTAVYSPAPKPKSLLASTTCFPSHLSSAPSPIVQWLTLSDWHCDWQWLGPGAVCLGLRSSQITRGDVGPIFHIRKPDPRLELSIKKPLELPLYKVKFRY